MKKIYIAVILIVGQILGTLITILAKATAPHRDRHEDVFQDFSASVRAALGSSHWFWTVLGAQLFVPFGFLRVFKKEQLSKPL